MPFPLRRFRLKREELGLTRPKLAELSGVDHRLIESLEQGRIKNPTMDTVDALGRGLGVTCEFFYAPDLPEEDASQTPPAKPKGKRK